ncbi:MAG: hypothetical protein HZB51_26210 [Chloroflexi bacterium]|nr:hypothetical protein [Chloroflexota bacterium]
MKLWIVLIVVLASCNPVSPSVVPTNTLQSVSPAASATNPMTPIVVASLQDLRQAVNEITNAQPEQAQAKADVLYQTLAASKRIPVVFGQQVVFLYKGNAQSVTWQGVFNGWGDRPGITGGRIGQTDLWIAQTEMPPASRFEYKITLNDKEWILDPANCRVQGHRTQKSPETSYTLLLSRHIRTSD